MSTTSQTPVTAFNKDEYLGYGSFYNMFFGIGIAISLLLIGLIFYIGGVKKL